MSRTAGTGVLVLGVVFGVVGAIMHWAMHVHPTGFNVNTAGLILFWVGIVTAISGLALTLMSNRSSVVRHEDVTHSPSGDQRYEEEHRQAML